MKQWMAVGKHSLYVGERRELEHLGKVQHLFTLSMAYSVALIRVNRFVA